MACIYEPYWNCFEKLHTSYIDQQTMTCKFTGYTLDLSKFLFFINRNFF